MILDDLWDFSDFNPCRSKILAEHSNIKNHKLMIRCIVNTQLDPPFAISYSGPISSKVLSENLNSRCSGISFRDILFDFAERVVESVDEDRRVHEIL